MIGWIVGAFKMAAGLASYFGVGAAIAFAGRFLPIGWGMVAGGAAVVLVHLFVWSADDTALKAQNAALRAKNAEIVATTEALRNTLSELSKAAQWNEAVMEDLRDQVAAMEDRPECTIPGGIVDELNKIN